MDAGRGGRRVSAPDAAVPAGEAEQGSASVGDLVRDGWARLRSGDLGSLPVILAIIVIWGYFQSKESTFLSARNLSNLILQIGVTGTLAVGIVLVLMLGEIDLSVGSVMILSSALVGWAIVNKEWSWYWAIILAIVVGAAIGAFQGTWFAIIGVPSFVVTLAGLLGWQGVEIHVLGSSGTINVFDPSISKIAGSYLPHFWGWLLAIALVAVYAVARVLEALKRRRAGLPSTPLLGVALGTILIAVIALFATAVLNGEFKTTVSESGKVAKDPIFRTLFGSYDSGVPTAGVILLGLVVFFHWVTTRTKFGRYIFAVGGNAEAARRAGINIKLIRIAVFSLCGSLAAIAGLIQTSRLQAASLAIDPGQVTLEAIAAAVIGGTSLFGGRGTVWSALLGALVIGSVGSGLDLIGQGPDVKLMVEGSILLLAVTLDAVARRGRASAGRV
jgi:D-xylose transport system permease protein